METKLSSVRQGTLRSLNLAVVLHEVLTSSTPVSRAHIAQSTGMTRSTVGRLVDELVAAGLVAELEVVTDGRRGRPATPLVAPQGTVAALGLEVNVGLICARVIDLSGQVLAQRIVTGDYRQSEPAAVLRELALLARSCLDEAGTSVQIVGAALAVPGLVDGDSGVILRAPNLGWQDVETAGAFAATQLLPPAMAVRVANEADCSAVVVAHEAPGRPSTLRDFLYISGEIGIGSALVWGGEVRLGRHGWAGEIGHMCIDPNGPRCGCGARGCLEVYAGQLAMCDACSVNGLPALQSLLDQGDVRAREVIAEAGRALGIALANALNLLDVSTVVLGGHLGQLQEQLCLHAMAELDERLLSSPFGRPDLMPTELDAASAATGAAFGVLARVIEDPCASILS
ncbi:ROK family transcriptional regulator [Gephyromycinifex aptenodytis]|uniref:ROK family transcriptional regulator n=1 Tax=Gephyromycinifex aptenodytis TaxID=2716227 RepID=UPI001446E43C|nr:ROK family transcriptional regulator [Gephyromycinifex aptenodytis]